MILNRQNQAYMCLAMMAVTLQLTIAWTTPTTTTTTMRLQKTSSSDARTTSSTTTTRLAAKPPPAASFDLESIEAFESQLDEEERELLVTTMGSDDMDHDDLLNNDEVKVFVVDEASHNKRIDAAIVAAFPDLSRSFCGSLVTDGQVSLHDNDNGVEKDDTRKIQQLIDRKSFKVQTGQQIRICIPHKDEITEIVAQDLPLDILYEDEHMIVLNKAAHMVVHPAAGNWDGTVVNALAYYLTHVSSYGKGDFVTEEGTLKSSDCNEISVEGTDGEPVNFRPGVVHRLDKGTTGVLVVAKTAQALAELSASFAGRKVKKTYLAITVGNPGKRVVIDKPIGRHPIHRQRMRVVPNPHRGRSSGSISFDDDNTKPASETGRRALSFVDTIAFDGRLSLVRVRIETGRTHQIRVHLSDRRTPIYGDDVYGLADWNKKLKEKQKIERPLLHAFRLEINHPVTGELMAFEAPLADDMLRIARGIFPFGQEETPSFLQDK